MKKLKNHSIKVRMTEEEMAYHLKQAASYNELSWAGGNLNQAMKRANELAAVHLLSPSYVLEVLVPAILETKEAINQIQKRLDVLTRMATKP